MKRFTGTEDAYLKTHAQALGYIHCASYLGRAYDTIRYRCRILDIQYKPQPANSLNKICSICEEEKPKSEFVKATSRHCKVCETAKKASWAKLNKDKINKHKRIYIKSRCKYDPHYKFARCLRSRIHAAIKGWNKAQSTIDLLGCSLEQLKAYLEAKFQAGMSWNNYGAWHLDHIKPCASFDLSKSEEQKICFHYSNLQPLWAKDNLRKGSSII